MLNQPPFKLRTAQASDYAIVGGWITDADGCRRWAGPRLPFPFEVTDLPALLNATLDTTFSLLDADRLVGFGQILTPAPGTVHLARIIIDPAARGHGLGATLCQLLMAHAVSTLAPNRFTLRVYSDNAAAIRTYAGLGFVTVDADPATAVLLMQKLVDR